MEIDGDYVASGVYVHGSFKHHIKYAAEVDIPHAPSGKLRITVPVSEVDYSKLQNMNGQDVRIKMRCDKRNYDNLSKQMKAPRILQISRLEILSS